MFTQVSAEQVNYKKVLKFAKNIYIHAIKNLLPSDSAKTANFYLDNKKFFSLISSCYYCETLRYSLVWRKSVEMAEKDAKDIIERYKNS